MTRPNTPPGASGVGGSGAGSDDQPGRSHTISCNQRCARPAGSTGCARWVAVVVAIDGARVSAAKADTGATQHPGGNTPCCPAARCGCRRGNKTAESSTPGYGDATIDSIRAQWRQPFTRCGEPSLFLGFFVDSRVTRLTTGSTATAGEITERAQVRELRRGVGAQSRNGGGVCVLDFHRLLPVN